MDLIFNSNNNKINKAIKIHLNSNNAIYRISLTSFNRISFNKNKLTKIVKRTMVVNI